MNHDRRTVTLSWINVLGCELWLAIGRAEYVVERADGLTVAAHPLQPTVQLSQALALAQHVADSPHDVGSCLRAKA
jgi:hypothetical protein